MTEDKTIRDKVMDMVTINFSITKCPQDIHEEFVGFCKAETNDNYSMGLKLLMERAQIALQINEILWRIQAIEDEMAEKSVAPLKKNIIKTMGSQNKVDKPEEKKEDRNGKRK